MSLNIKITEACSVLYGYADARNLRKSEATVQPYNPKTEEVEACETSFKVIRLCGSHNQPLHIISHLYHQIKKSYYICKRKRL